MIRNEIEAVVKMMTTNNGHAPAFVYGTYNELNLKADNTPFPVVFMLSIKPATLSMTNSKSINEKYNIYLEFLTLTDFGEFTSENEAVINQQLEAAKEFMILLNEYRPDELQGGRYFRVNLKDGGQTMPVYNKYNTCSTGVSLTLTLKTMYNNPICV